MARLDERDHAYFTTVRGMCRTCRSVVPARVFFRHGQVWQESICPGCASEPAMIASDAEWYLKSALRTFPDRSPLRNARPASKGCPHDCGPCAWHASPCTLPVVPVTNVCDMSCPVCFTCNRPDRPWHMPADEMRRIMDWIVDSSGPVDLVNVTGGEPTLHPGILGILECARRPAIGRVMMSSNGMRLAEDEDLCGKLAAMGVHVRLSFNTFDREASVAIHGADVVDAKLRAIENLTRAGVKMTLLNVMIRGVNEDAAGRILDLMRGNDGILGLTVETTACAGRGGGPPPARARIPVDEAARIVCRGSGGELAPSDFLPRLSAHPLCYLTCHLLKQGGGFVPFTRFATAERIAGLMGDSYLVRLEKEHDLFRDAMNDVYVKGDSERLGVFRRLIERLYPKGEAPGVFERQRIAEPVVRTVYVHSRMDEDTFDCARAMLCPDLVPTEPGRLVPACVHELFAGMKGERLHVPM